MIIEINSSLAIWKHGWYFKSADAWPQDWREADAVAGGLDNH